MIAGPEGNHDAAERTRGFRSALAAAGRDPDSALVVAGDFRESSGFAAANFLMKRESRPTAVFAANDNMAIGLMSALRSIGVRVPDDMAVVGFDNVTTARYLNPALTTVDVDAFALGRQAVAMMLEIVDDEGQPTPDRQVLTASLTIRESCGAHWMGTAATRRQMREARSS
jgi:DNA-binding LacI/PurR family transcriptional regulator